MRVLELKCKRKMHLQSLYMFYRGYYLGKKKVPVTTPFSWNFMLDTYGGVIVFFFFFWEIFIDFYTKFNINFSNPKCRVEWRYTWKLYQLSLGPKQE